MKKDIYDSIIIGGGFYGLYIADFIASQGKRVLLCEYEDSCMTHASYNNQARIHSGYHYPAQSSDRHALMPFLSTVHQGIPRLRH